MKEVRYQFQCSELGLESKTGMLTANYLLCQIIKMKKTVLCNI